jgi:hypothetical protein
MTRSPLRRAISFAAFALFIPAALIGCPKKAAPVEDAGAAPPPASTPEVTELAPLVEEAGPDADAEAGPRKWGGGGFNSNQLKVKECCNAMRAQAKQMGQSPEAFQITTLAAQCDAVAVQIGPAGNAPEFAQLRAILKSIKLPSACQF